MCVKSDEGFEVVLKDTFEYHSLNFVLIPSLDKMKSND